MVGAATTETGRIGLIQKEKIPKVSVCVITYNQEKYIRQCLQSIVDQETNFNFEVIVGDDFSTDGTRQIVAEFADRYPGIIIPVLHANKVGGTENYVDSHNRARGEYVAHIDGDDLALPGKLQTQVNYLDANPDCSVVWHRMNVFDDAESLCTPNLPDLSMYENGKVYLSDLLEFGSVSYHSSTMYRSKSRKTRHIEGEVLDWYFNVEFLMSGYGKYLEPILGKYRFISSNNSRKGDGPYRIRKIYALHLEHYLKILPELRKEVFINSMLHFMVDAKNGRISSMLFLKLAMKSLSLVSVNVFIKALIRYRRINPRII